MSVKAHMHRCQPRQEFENKLEIFSCPMPFCTKGAKASIRVGNRRDLVMVNRICVYEVQLNNRIRVISEKCPGPGEEKFPHSGEKFPQYGGEDQSSIEG